MQAGGEGLDGGAAARDLPPVLRQGRHAHLCRQHGGAVQVEQEGVGHGAGQLLLGLLLHPSVRRLRERPVRSGGERPWLSRETLVRVTKYPGVPPLSTQRFGGRVELTRKNEKGK